MRDFTPLRAVFPAPVFVPLGGELYSVAEFTLGDLATLDRWLDSLVDPVADIVPAVCDPEPDTRKARLVAAWRGLGDRPYLGTDAGAELLDSVEGRAVQLLIACDRAGSPIDAERAMAAVTDATVAEWMAFDRAAWAVPAWRSIARELDPDWWMASLEESAGNEDDDPADWGRTVVRLVMDRGWKLADIQAVTIGQWRLLCRGGKAERYTGPPQRDGESAADWLARSAAVFSLPEEDQESPE